MKNQNIGQQYPITWIIVIFFSEFRLHTIWNKRRLLRYIYILWVVLSSICQSHSQNLDHFDWTRTCKYSKQKSYAFYMSFENGKLTKNLWLVWLWHCNSILLVHLCTYSRSLFKREHYRSKPFLFWIFGHRGNTLKIFLLNIPFLDYNYYYYIVQ